MDGIDELDATGTLDWDSASLLHSLVTSHEPSLLRTPPETCLELGAGTGRMAVALAETWEGSLHSYIATDLDVRVPALQEPLSASRLRTVSAAALPAALARLEPHPRNKEMQTSQHYLCFHASKHV